MILEEVGANDLLPQWIHVTWKRNGWNRRNILKKVAGKAGYIAVPRLPSSVLQDPRTKIMNL